MSSYREADEIINDLKVQTNHDYSAHRDEIEQFYDDYLMNGNWDGTLEFESGMPALRFIQEDEFDQHRSDDMPEEDEDNIYSAGHYVWILE
jgi:hypothetical protein